MLAGASVPAALAQSSSETIARDLAAAHYETALGLFEDEDLEGAMSSIKDALLEDESFLPAHILLARVFLRVGGGAAAEGALDDARRLGADPAILWPLRADALFLQHKYRELVALTPSEGLPRDAQTRVLLTRGAAYIELEEYTQADQNLETAIALQPDDPAPRVQYASSAFRRGELDTAERRAMDALDTGPEDAGAWNILASINHARGKATEALEAYERALTLNPVHRDARVSRAALLVDLRRDEEARVDLDFLAEHFPRDPRAPYLDYIVLQRQGKGVEARAALDRTVQLLMDMDPAEVQRSAQLELLAGMAHYELGAFEQSRAHLSAYIRRNPEAVGPRKVLASIMLRERQPADAIEVLLPATTLAPNDSSLLALLGTAYMQDGRPERAATYLERAIAIDEYAPSNVRTRLALSRMDAGFAGAGLDELEALFTGDPEGNRAAGTILVVAFMKQKRYDDALSVAQQLTTANPDDLSLRNLLGTAELASGDATAAEQTFNSILETDPQFLPARANLAQLEASSGRLDAARTRLLGLLDDRPASVNTMIQLAQVEERAGRPQETLRWLLKARDIDARSVRVVLALTNFHLRQGDAKAALAIAEDASTWAEDDLDVMSALGRALAASGRPDVASTVYRKMATVAGFDTANLYRVATLQLSVGAGKDAAYTLTKALQGNPDHLPSRVLLVQTELGYGSGETALALAEALAGDYPELALGQRLLGDAYMRAGRFEEAISSYQKSRGLEASTMTTLRLYRAHVASGDKAGARDLLLAWVQTHPSDSTARAALAEDFLADGELDSARAHYEQHLELEPDNPMVLNNLAYILDKQQDPRAYEFAQRAHGLSPDNPAISDTIGWLMVRRGEPALGLRYLRNAESRASGHPEINYHIGAALAALDRKPEARRALERALSHPDGFADAAAASALLDKLKTE
jgi:putative PEP-CTERM system TPR-repeat lipoprotein